MFHFHLGDVDIQRDVLGDLEIKENEIYRWWIIWGKVTYLTICLANIRFELLVNKDKLHFIGSGKVWGLKHYDGT